MILAFRPWSTSCRNYKEYLYLYLILIWQRRVDIIDQVELWSPRQVHIYPLCGIFHFPWHSVSSERHWQSGVKAIAKVSKRPQWNSNLRPLDCQSRALTTEPSRPSISMTAVGMTVPARVGIPLPVASKIYFPFLPILWSTKTWVLYTRLF